MSYKAFMLWSKKSSLEVDMSLRYRMKGRKIRLSVKRIYKLRIGSTGLVSESSIQELLIGCSTQN